MEPTFAFWALAAIVLALILLLVTAGQHRRHAADTDQRLCRACGETHRAFARFCRRCGRELGKGE